MDAGPSRNAKELVQPTVQANKEHQYALKVYTERLEAELEHLDKLLASVEVSENEEEDIVNAGGSVMIPGASQPRGPIPMSELTSESSPFYHDALKKQRYEEFTVVHPMKAQELEALADAVHSENYRLYALHAQSQGLQTFTDHVEPPPGFINNNKLGIDWERVAQKVSSVFPSVQRTALECEIRWLGDRHPEFSDTQWTQAEMAKLRELVHGALPGQVDWNEVAEKLGTKRTPVDCMRHVIPRRTHSWNVAADKRLLEAVKIYGIDSWALVARWVSEDATPAQCQGRYMRTVDPTLKRGPWTPDEDERLKEAVAALGHSWIDVATFVEGRNNEQCRDRYQEYLNPSVAKGKWTEEQDAALLKAVEQVGLGKWKEVSQLLNTGRTDNMCRMRYAMLAKRAQPAREAAQRSASPSAPAKGEMSANGGQQEIVILHPESLGARVSNSPVPTTKPKPKPRPRKKAPSAAGDAPNPTFPDQSREASQTVAGPNATAEDGSESRETSAQAGFKRPADDRGTEIASTRARGRGLEGGGEAEGGGVGAQWRNRQKFQSRPTPWTLTSTKRTRLPSTQACH
ncbi:hypothetical protein BD413DRAFT_604069 [Trametes elegans]|nr:hypothetical protein BD413DRAFT_604069 [Trametes elegans]